MQVGPECSGGSNTEVVCLCFFLLRPPTKSSYRDVTIYLFIYLLGANQSEHM